MYFTVGDNSNERHPNNDIDSPFILFINTFLSLPLSSLPIRNLLLSYFLVDTKMNDASSAMNRFLTGQNLFLTDFRYEGDTMGTVGLGTEFPSKILRFNLKDHPGSQLICQKGAFLASNQTVDVTMEFTQSLSAGFFGGQGFVLQKLSGDGDVLVKGGGKIVQKELKAGETLRVTSGSIVAFESSMDYDIQMLSGIKNVMFGGEGLFVTKLTGPGRVWLQSMPPDRMIAEIARRVPSGGGIGLGVPIGGMGGGSSGGDAAAGEAGADGAEGASGGAGAAAAGESVAATDAAVEADRNATVASSGMSPNGGDPSPVDPDTPSALFGDAAPETTSKPVNDAAGDDSSSFATQSTEQTFSDDDGSSYGSSPESSNETSFSDDFSTDEFKQDDFADGEIFDDSASSESAEVETPSEEGGSGFFQSIWDFFSDDD
jgi:uncharacterized protein (TIGR00266 family)